MAKKMSPLAWIAIGCGGLLLLAAVGVVLLGLWGKRKVDEFRDNPAMAMAKIYAAANPDVKIVGSDDANQTVTFEDEKTGKQVTVNLEQIKEGKISFETEEGTTSFSADEHSGQVVGPDGQKTTWGENVALPDWVPSYPGTKPVGIAAVNADAEVGGMFQMQTSDAPDKVLEWYKKTLGDGGFVQKGTLSTSGDGSSMHSIDTRNEQTKQEITVTVVTSPSEPMSNIQITYRINKDE